MNPLRPYSQRLLNTPHRYVSRAPRAHLLLSRLARLGHPRTQPHPNALPPRPSFSGFHAAATRRNAVEPTPSDPAQPDSQKRRTLPYKPAPHRNPDEPVYQLAFTCNACEQRSAHTISKQGYHKGTVLVTCPGCKNRHLIADHLRIFSDSAVTLQDLMNKKGEEIQTGTVGQNGEVEFWDQDTVDASAQN